jgi:chromate transporter
MTVPFMALEETLPIAPAKPTLAQLAGFFLKLGTIAFGGPAAHIAMMQDELVKRRGWVTSEDFLDLLAVANLIPGPSSTELAIYIGHRLRGRAGLLIAGACFILPAFAMVLALAHAYKRYGQLPEVGAVLHGVEPVVVAIVVQALWRLGKTAIKTRWLAALGLAAFAVTALGANPVLVLAGTGLIALAAHLYDQPSADRRKTLSLALVPIPLAAWASSASLSAIFLAFLKIGSVVFGSGYVLLAFLQSDMVVHRHWLTEHQLIDAIAVGQVTPGPVFTTATFIGYLIAGNSGAVAATAGIFAPAFFFVAATGPLIRYIRRSNAAAAALNGLNVGSLALMAFVTVQFAKFALVDIPAAMIGVVSAALMLFGQVNSVWLIAGGALAGFAWKIVASH